MHLSARCQEDSGTLVDISRLAKFPRISHGINIAFHPRAPTKNTGDSIACRRPNFLESAAAGIICLSG